jgi:hypothetical protein
MRIEPKQSIRAGRLVAKKESSPALLRVSDDYLVLIYTGALIAISLSEFVSLVKDSASITYQILTLLLVIALSLGFYFSVRTIKRNYSLTWIETGLDKVINRELSQRAVESVGWRLIENYKSYLVALTGASGFTWGQEITVIFDDGGVFMNVRNRSMVGGRSPWLFGKGKKCLKRLSEELERLKDWPPPNKSFEITPH